MKQLHLDILNNIVNSSELKFTFICAPGPGGQNVNKVATAALLRFNVVSSPSLPEEVRQRLLALVGKKITLNGDVVIKASRYRTQQRNKQDALERLEDLLKRAVHVPRKRKKTRPSLASKQRHLTTKKLHGITKKLRSNKPSSE